MRWHIIQTIEIIDRWLCKYNCFWYSREGYWYSNHNLRRLVNKSFKPVQGQYPQRKRGPVSTVFYEIWNWFMLQTIFSYLCIICNTLLKTSRNMYNINYLILNLFIYTANLRKGTASVPIASMSASSACLS